MEQLGLSMTTGAASVAPAMAATQAVMAGPRSAQGNVNKADDAPVPEGRRGNVTEVILPPGQVENFQLLLPMLTQLNQERRWLAWIDPPQELVSKWQTMHGIVASELLVLRSTRDYSAFELAERALGAGRAQRIRNWGGAAHQQRAACRRSTQRRGMRAAPC